jgi:tryptophan synthase beta subunit
VVCLSGRGDKDMGQLQSLVKPAAKRAKR